MFTQAPINAVFLFLNLFYLLLVFFLFQFSFSFFCFYFFLFFCSEICDGCQKLAFLAKQAAHAGCAAGRQPTRGYIGTFWRRMGDGGRGSSTALSLIALWKISSAYIALISRNLIHFPLSHSCFLNHRGLAIPIVRHRASAEQAHTARPPGQRVVSLQQRPSTRATSTAAQPVTHISSTCVCVCVCVCVCASNLHMYISSCVVESMGVAVWCWQTSEDHDRGQSPAY